MPSKPKAQAVPTAIKNYYDTLDSITSRGAANEGATRIAFQTLLDAWCKPVKMVVLGEHPIEGTRKQPVRPDGVLVDDLKLRRGYWEAKDTKDDLQIEINKKITAGYPLSNIPQRVFEYKLGNRSALEWMIDQYRVSIYARSGLRHDPNQPDDPRAIVRLVEQVIRVSLDTLDIIASLPPL